ncbi:MAG: mrdA [Gemmatimonadetes bacterium]|nr:mrdA [Gemmatimonadota bacterium]
MRPENPFHPSSRRQRAVQATLAIFAVLCCLGAAFFRTQIVRNNEFNLRADGNRFRVVPVPAPRGTIYDRDGRVVAETVAGYTLALEPGPPDSIRRRLEPLRGLLGLDSAEVEQIVAQSRKSRIEPVTISDGLTFGQVSKLEEGRGRMPGVILDPHPIRHYPYGESMGHVIGYVAEISDAELLSRAWTGYRSGQHVGKAGVERAYDRALGGTPGARYVEVDARGKVVGTFAKQVYVPPKAGSDLRLTVDLDLQRYAHQIFPKDKRGAIVAMVPGTGEVLAMYSQPSYDPNQLIGRIRPEVWRALNEGNARPMLNRATLATYPPGSTWKLATAVVALEHRVVGPRDRMPIPCTGGMTFQGRYARCAKKDGHGFLDLVGAIASSCNVYFYQLGIRLGLDMLAAEGTRMGFSHRTGVDLPSERSGTFPASREWYHERFGHRPPPSEVMNVAIGQGPNDQTPIRMAQFYSALASSGVALAPHVVRGARAAPVETDLHVSRQTLATVREAMARVVEEGGTAAAVALENWTLYGKTGTAQNSQDPEHNHAWFTGFAGPHGKDPEIVVATIVEFGGHGGETAAPLAAKVADFYLNKRHHVPGNPPLEPEGS